MLSCSFKTQVLRSPQSSFGCEEPQPSGFKNQGERAGAGSGSEPHPGASQLQHRELLRERPARRAAAAAPREAHRAGLVPDGELETCSLEELGFCFELVYRRSYRQELGLGFFSGMAVGLSRELFRDDCQPMVVFSKAFWATVAD